MIRRNRRPLLVASMFAGAFGASCWLLVTACSSTPSATPAVDSGAGGDESPPPPPEDSGAPDVVGDTVNAPCNPVKQDCADPTLRCQIVYVDGEYRTGCQPPFSPATNKEGDICSRKYAGYDDCEKGLHCMPDGVTATACRRLCAKDSDCAPDSKCGAITTTGPDFGACWRTCTPFGTECGSRTCAGARTHIDGVSDFESCREIGSGDLGSPCTAQWNCKEDMNCQGSSPTSFKCVAMCDDAHPCDGGTCKKRAGIPNNGGVCQ